MYFGRREVDFRMKVCGKAGLEEERMAPLIARAR